MRTAARISAYGVGLAVAFATAFVAGSAAGPLASEVPEHGSAAHHGGGRAADPHGADDAAEALPGLATTQDGYTLVPASSVLDSGTDAPFLFTITGPDGSPVTEYVEQHGKELHLVVVRRDFVGYQHVHPVRAADGTWSASLSLAAAGTYRVFADFEPSGLGRGLTLGTDVAVPGEYVPARTPAAAPTVSVQDVEVTLSGEPAAGRETVLSFSLRRDGRPVTDLEPYLGAFGHLVSLRSGDLAYLHTHPTGSGSARNGGPTLRFATTFPTPGTYRLYLDFARGGAVSTAEFVVVVPTTDDDDPSSAPMAADGDHAH